MLLSLAESIEQFVFLFFSLNRGREYSYAIYRLDTHIQRMEKFSHRNENTALKHKKNGTSQKSSNRCELSHSYMPTEIRTAHFFSLSVRVHIAVAHIHEHRHPANTISLGLCSEYMHVFMPLGLSTVHCVLSLFVVIVVDVVFAVFIHPSLFLRCHS